MYENKKIDWIHLEITELCNLKCPLCARTYYNDYPGGSPYNKSLGLADIKKFFPPNFIKSSELKYVLLCGSYGDPVMARDLEAILHYFTDHGVEVSIATNGALKSSSWWRSLGETSQKGIDVIFAIDGMSDTNHIYRVGADWDKLMENCQAFIDGGGKAIWQFIPFKHNEHQVEEAKALAKKMGFHSFVIRKSNRLMWCEDETYQGLKDPENSSLNIENRDQKKMDINQWINKGQAPIIPQCKSISSTNHPLILKKLSGANIKVTARGFVYPCGWLQPQSWYEDNGFDSQELCLFNSSIEEVMSHEFFTKGIHEKWKAGSIKVCVGFCSKNAVIEQEEFLL
jgi:MoaA/NifB/PqqE/SkfB family radical SAM enzyme